VAASLDSIPDSSGQDGYRSEQQRIGISWNRKGEDRHDEGKARQMFRKRSNKSVVLLTYTEVARKETHSGPDMLSLER
jgi:hypothetical protein